MSSKRKKHRTSPHRQFKKQLLPPFVDKFPNMTTIRWIEDQLPQFLWIDALLHEYGSIKAISVYNQTLDILDAFVDTSKSTPLLGTVYCFNRIPDMERHRVAVAIEGITGALPDGFLKTISFYPEHPMNWVVPETWRNSHRIDPEEVLSYLRKAVIRLLNGRSEHSAFCRSMPLNRMFKHNKLFLVKGGVSDELIEGIEQYPYGPHRDHVESWARNTMNTILQNNWSFDWSSHFWNHNYKTSICEFAFSKGISTSGASEIRNIMEKGQQFCTNTAKQIEQRFKQISLNLYDPDEDEVINGLLSRQLRITTAILTDPHLWSIDIGRILLRCLVDGLMTMSYLVKENNKELYKRFKKHSLGHQKLLQIHLEKLADQFGEVDGNLEDMIEDLKQNLNEEVWEELLPIDLGSWTDKDTRKIAIDVGLKDLYDFFYSPASAEVHGEWISLRDINLAQCTNPLHKFHRVPRFERPPLSTGIPLQASEYLEKSYVVWCNRYGLNSSFEHAIEYQRSLTGETK